MGLAVSFDESFDNRCNERNISKKINTVQSDYDYKNIVSLTDNEVHNFLEGGKKQNTKTRTESSRG